MQSSTKAERLPGPTRKLVHEMVTADLHASQGFIEIKSKEVK